MNPVKAKQVADNLTSSLTFLLIFLTMTKQEDIAAAAEVPWSRRWPEDNGALDHGELDRAL
jgi:hypothetical protein